MANSSVVDLRSAMFHLRGAMERAARAETDPQMKVHRVKALTVLQALEQGMAGYEEPLEALWKAARSVLGQNAIATSVRANHREPDEMEGLYVRLVERLTHVGSEKSGRSRSGKSDSSREKGERG